MKTFGNVVIMIIAAILLFWGGYWYDRCYDRPCPPCPEIAVIKPLEVKKPVVKRIAAPTLQPAPMPKQTIVPALAPAPIPQLILRINVVEWSQKFAGKSLMSRDIGPIIQQGLANGTVIRTRIPFIFRVNGSDVVVQGGSAIVNSGPIKPETALVIQPLLGEKFASPPNGLPLTTNPGELDAMVRQGMSEIWLNFILVPAR